MTVYVLVEGYGSIVEGVQLFPTMKEADDEFIRITGYSYEEFWGEGNGENKVPNEYYDECKIFIIDEYSLVPTRRCRDCAQLIRDSEGKPVLTVLSQGMCEEGGFSEVVLDEPRAEEECSAFKEYEPQ